MQELIDKVVKWGHDRNLNAPENIKGQTMKLCSEFGEIGDAVESYSRRDEIDGIGDVLVVAIIIGQQLAMPIEPHDLEVNDGGYDTDFYRAAARLGTFTDYVLKEHRAADQRLQLGYFVNAIVSFANWRGIYAPEALASAYNEIKDRKGVMYKGAFIKEADSRYPEVMRELGRDA